MPNIAVMGLGKIAKKFLETLNKLNIEIYACASRNLDNALEYQKNYNIKKAYGSYEELLNDESVDIVYLATPHGLHYSQMLDLLNHNKNIICEKAFTVNKKQAEEIFKIAKEKKLLVMEALWSNFLPAMQKLVETINSKKYGDIISLEATFTFNGDLNPNNRLNNKMLGGGALLDIGIYCLNFAYSLLGDYKDIKTLAKMSKENVDLACTSLYTSKLGKVATLHYAIDEEKGRFAKILLDEAYIEVPLFWQVSEYFVYDYNDNLIEKIAIPFEVNGFEYQILSYLNSYKLHQLENEIMPHSKTLKLLEMMDLIALDFH